VAALWIDSGHDVLEDTVLAGRVHGLEDEEHCVPIVGVQQVLLRAEKFDLILEQRPVMLLRSVKGPDFRGPFFWIDRATFANAESCDVDRHGGSGVYYRCLLSNSGGIRREQLR
jgi:hypothetical protein